MDATALTVVSQLITDARSRFGTANVEAVAVDRSLFDETMEQVLALGGDVSLDVCVVDGITVRELREGGETPLVYLKDADEPQPLSS
jgi:hypothetical protein